MTATRILGIDPGFSNLGIFGITAGLSLKAEFAKLILTEKGEDPEGQYADDLRRLVEIETAFEAILEEFKPTLVATERVPSLRNAQVTRQIAMAFGAMHALARKRNIPVVCFHPETIKAELTGSRKADKSKMAKKLISLFPAFSGWPALGAQKAKRKNAKVTKTDGIAHVVDAAGACVCAARNTERSAW